MSNNSKLISEIFGSSATEHRDGIPWHEAKRPFPLHKCQAQTTGFVGLSEVQRCACGSIRNGANGYWLRKNDRWKSSKFPFVAGAIAGGMALVALVAVFLIF